MKKKIILILILALMLSITGCGKGQGSSEDSSVDLSNTSKESDPSTYKYDSNDSRFKIVSVEEIDDGTTNGENISILVDKETKIMYIFLL